MKAFLLRSNAPIETNPLEMAEVAAPLLCAGIIGFRSLRLSGITGKVRAADWVCTALARRRTWRFKSPGAAVIALNC